METVLLPIYYDNKDVEFCQLMIIDDEEYYGIKLVNKDNVINYEDDSFFGALIKLRLDIEKKGGILQCNGSDKNIYPSAMQMSMGGEKAYFLELGKPASLKKMYKIFDTDKPDLHCVTVSEQREFFETWINSIGRDNV